MPFFTKVRKIVWYSRQFNLAKASETKVEDTRLRKHLDFWQVVFYPIQAMRELRPRLRSIGLN